MCEVLATERNEGRKEMAREAAASLFLQGISYEMVLNAFKKDLSREELSQIEQEAKKDKP